MRQSWQFRLLGLFMLPLYAMGAWIAPALQVCPMHGSPAATHAGTDMSAMGMSAMDMPAMDMPAAHAGHSPNAVAPQSTLGAQDASAPDGQLAMVSNSAAMSDAPASAHTHGCDCLGCCAGSNGPAVPVAQLALSAPATTSHESFEMKNAEAVVTRLAHVLPFATAPPYTLV